MPQGLVIHTIGHSDHSTVELLDLLRRNEITLVVDVRSQPYSRWTHQFNRETLAHDLEEAGLTYRFMGDTLGGRPDDPTLYEPGEERPSYERMEQTAAYRSSIDKLLELAQAEPVALMCSEGDHHHCHRHLLITQTLLAREVKVFHIQPDGTKVSGEPIARQLSLF
jgi:uncharacterized protein (DUF488 family)